VEITVPTTRPLPAVRAVAGQLNAAAGNSGSDLTCGQVRSLDAKINALAAALERRNFHAACGVSGGLVNELEALVESAQLDPITAPPFPGTSPNVVENAQFINSQFCAAARGELTPPPM
jgi:hypothetical protein